MPRPSAPATKRHFLRRALRIAAFAAVAFAAQPSAADSFTPLGDGWRTYVNARYGARFDYPADMFAPGAMPANGDGLRFTAPDATLELYTWRNTQGESGVSLKQRMRGTRGYTNVTYSPAGKGWLVLSGFRGDNIFYEKYVFRNGVVSGFGMEFPRARKPLYAPIVERIEDSFHAGHAD